ncbi:glycosyltransferase, partial [Aquimarina celericrescens]|nr:glycosyltransferase [Aquimarina celericrescens]
RIARIFGIKSEKLLHNSSKGEMLQRHCVGVVIPCYNEEKRLLSKEFIDFTHSNLGYHLCFVNDGSTDKTLEVLKKLSKGRED